ncbi:hypothetical protein P280DRAFT_465199 [Massarina eburnea CBS 473.64]|uniref:Uncharacterized protein n=1 Tax=Massarina eburnea CBS 473.64 TaxID=1395130 RepID=A0A6A6SC60_9PLEO|nr:hypothetical protein P280DRAFT_465199 [Massarina eburnea CBS 473.64]
MPAVHDNPRQRTRTCEDRRSLNGSGFCVPLHDCYLVSAILKAFQAAKIMAENDAGVRFKEGITHVHLPVAIL